MNSENEEHKPIPKDHITANETVHSSIKPQNKPEIEQIIIFYTDKTFNHYFPGK